MSANETWIVFGKWTSFWILECQQTGQRVMTEPREGGAVLNTVQFPRKAGE